MKHEVGMPRVRRYGKVIEINLLDDKISSGGGTTILRTEALEIVFWNYKDNRCDRLSITINQCGIRFCIELMPDPIVVAFYAAIGEPQVNEAIARTMALLTVELADKEATADLLNLFKYTNEIAFEAGQDTIRNKFHSLMYVR